MKILFTAFVLISCNILFSKGLPKHKDRVKKTNKLTHFFQENNSNISTPEKQNKSDNWSNKHLTKIKISGGYKDEKSLNESTVRNTSHAVKTNKLTHFFQENNSNISTPEKQSKSDNWSNKHLTKINISEGYKDRKSLNESKVRNTSHAVKHKTNHSKSSLDESKQRATIRKLLCKLFNIGKEDESCKDKHHSKKAMIWPTKMLPWLKSVLMNKMNRGENHMSFLDNMEDPTESPFDGQSINSISDNWDGNPLLMHRKHRHGLKMVPLLKMLKVKLSGQRSPNSAESLNDALNNEGLNGFGPLPTQGSSRLMRQILKQALGSSDRNAVLNEMRQELLLASNRGESEGTEGVDDLTGRNNLAQLNSGLQGSPVMSELSQGAGLEQAGGMSMLQGNMRTPLMEQPIHAQMLDNGVIAPMPRQPVHGSPLKAASLFGGPPIGRSPLIGTPLRMSSLEGSPISSPTSRSPPLPSSFLGAPPRGGSLLQRAGGFDLPMSSSMLQRAANPTQRMYTDSEEEVPDFASQEDNFIERNEPEERHSPRATPLGNNLVMEEISDNMARGRNPPAQTNPDLDRLMKLPSGFRSTGPARSRLSRLGLGSNFENGLRLPLGSNSLGMSSILAKDEDSINFDDLNSQHSLAFRRGKVLKGASNSHGLIPTEKSTSKRHKKADSKSKDGN